MSRIVFLIIRIRLPRVSYRDETLRLSQIEMNIYKILDGFNLLCIGINKQNIVKALSDMSKSTIHRIVSKG